jgi:hypothetical protein
MRHLISRIFALDRFWRDSAKVMHRVVRSLLSVGVLIHWESLIELQVDSHLSSNRRNHSRLMGASFPSKDTANGTMYAVRNLRRVLASNGHTGSSSTTVLRFRRRSTSPVLFGSLLTSWWRPLRARGISRRMPGSGKCSRSEIPFV